MKVVPTSLLDVVTGVSRLMEAPTNRPQLMMAAGMLIGSHSTLKTPEDFEGWSRAACNLLYQLGNEEEYA
jgi:hypothetical protein